MKIVLQEIESNGYIADVVVHFSYTKEREEFEIFDIYYDLITDEEGDEIFLYELDEEEIENLAAAVKDKFYTHTVEAICYDLWERSYGY